MTRNFLFYWRRDQIAAVLDYGVLEHAASDQFERVTPGDTIWICGATERSRLVTIGPLRVGEVVSQQEAEQRLGRALWNAEYHVLAAEPVEARDVTLDHVLHLLSFLSRDRPRLDLNAASIGQQLQTMRELTIDAEGVMEALWAQGDRASAEAEPAPAIDASGTPSSHAGDDTLPDEALPLYQLHCRYARLSGLAIAEAAALWREMGGKHESRTAHMQALLHRLASAQQASTDDGCLVTWQRHSALEGQARMAEITRRMRDPAVSYCRLELDGFTCQYCGYTPPTEVTVREGQIAQLGAAILEVHHIDPLCDGERTTNLEDLVTLCPTCHKLLHAIGRALELERLPVQVLERSLQASPQ